MQTNIEYSPLFYFDKPLTEKPVYKPKPVIEIKQEDKLKPIENIVLFEKHRPTRFNEIMGQEKTINIIKRNLNNLPHMILEGSAGTGKTTLVKVICNELNAELLELNSSNERGIDTIRKNKKIPGSGKIAEFVKCKSLHNMLKIVFFDEADGMTSEAQDCLKAMIERYSHSTRFIFACNDINKIIGPLRSRCKTFHFENINPIDMKNRLNVIIELENITINNKELDSIIENSNGDFRKAINDLQTI